MATGQSLLGFFQRRRQAAYRVRKEVLGLDPPRSPDDAVFPRYSLVIFDLDGTLVDSRRDIATSVNDVRVNQGLPALPLDEIQRHIGWGVAHLLEHSIPEISDLVQIGRVFLQSYQRRMVETTALFPHALEVISSLIEGGVRVAVVSNKPEDLARELLRRLGIHLLFVDICGGDRYTEKKPHPRPILEVHQRFGGQRGTLVVGDSVVDVQAATAAGLPVCLISEKSTRPIRRSDSPMHLCSLEEVLGVCRVPGVTGDEDEKEPVPRDFHTVFHHGS